MSPSLFCPPKGALVQAEEEGDLAVKVAVPVRASTNPSGGGLMVEPAADGNGGRGAATSMRTPHGKGACAHLSAARAVICAGGAAPTGACGDIMEAFRGACGQEQLAETNEKNVTKEPKGDLPRHLCRRGTVRVLFRPAFCSVTWPSFCSAAIR